MVFIDESSLRPVLGEVSFCFLAAALLLKMSVAIQPLRNHHHNDCQLILHSKLLFYVWLKDNFKVFSVDPFDSISESGNFGTYDFCHITRSLDKRKWCFVNAIRK